MVEMGTGDVFKDLGFTDASERRLRTELAMRLNNLIKERQLTQTMAAKIFSISQAEVSELHNFKLNHFSSEKLQHLISLLDRDVEPIKDYSGRFDLCVPPKLHEQLAIQAAAHGKSINTWIVDLLQDQMQLRSN